MGNKAYLKNAVVGLAVAIIGVIIVWLIAQPISPDLRADSFNEDNQKIGIPVLLTAILFDGVLAVIVGWILFHFQKPRLWWYVIVVAVLIFSAVNAIVQATTDETAIWLNIMHLVAAAAIVPAIGRMLPAD